MLKPETHIHFILALFSLKVLGKIAADDILFIFSYFSEKIRLGISCELSARQMIQMECQALFSFKNTKRKKEKENMLFAAVVISTMGYKIMQF